MPTYIQVRDCDSGPVLTVPIHEAKTIIDSMVENAEQTSDEPEKYSFQPVVMSEQEFNDLPEFTGF